MCKAWYQIAGRDSIFARFARSDDNVGFQRDVRDKRAQNQTSLLARLAQSPATKVRICRPMT
jgi:hypothetical protein